MHLSILPLALVRLAVGPAVLAVAIDVSLLEGALVESSICESEPTHSVLFTALVATDILGTIRPDLFTLTVLNILLPLT